MGLEPTTFGLGSRHSTTELRPQKHANFPACKSIRFLPFLSISLLPPGCIKVEHNPPKILFQLFDERFLLEYCFEVFYRLYFLSRSPVKSGRYNFYLTTVSNLITF